MDFVDDAPSGPSTIEAILDDARQDAVLRDLGYFFGANAGPFIRLYEDIRARPRSSPFLRPSWNWAVLLMSYAWFIYRKQWLLALLSFACVTAGSFPSYGWVGWVMNILSLIFPIIANPLYVRQALAKIAFANAIGLAGERRMAYLVRAGGTWPLGGILAAILSIVCLTAIFVAWGLKFLVQFNG